MPFSLYAVCRTDGTRGRASRVKSIFWSSRLDFLSELKPNHVPVLRNEHVRNSTNELSSAMHKLFFFRYAVFAGVVCFVFCVCVCLCAHRTIYSILFYFFFEIYIEIKINKESAFSSRKKIEHYVVCASRKPLQKKYEKIVLYVYCSRLVVGSRV